MKIKDEIITEALTNICNDTKMFGIESGEPETGDLVFCGSITNDISGIIRYDAQGMFVAAVKQDSGAFSTWIMIKEDGKLCVERSA